MFQIEVLKQELSVLLSSGAATAALLQSVKPKLPVEEGLDGYSKLARSDAGRKS